MEEGGKQTERENCGDIRLWSQGCFPEAEDTKQSPSEVKYTAPAEAWVPVIQMRKLRLRKPKLSSGAAGGF